MGQLAQVRLLLQTECLYRLVYQPFLVLPKPLIEHLQPLVPAFQVQQSHQIEFLYILEEGKPAQDLLLLQIGCQYILVFHLSQGIQQIPIAHLYILAGKAESPVRRWHQLEFPCILVVELLSLVQQPLRTGYLYRMVYQPFLVLQWHLIESLCTLDVGQLAQVRQ